MPFLEFGGALMADGVAAAESALPPLLRALGGDLLRAVAEHLDDADLPCLRLTCKAFRDHSSPAQKKCRTDYLRTRALAVFACARMPGFVVDLPTMLYLAARVGCVAVLAELVVNRQCALTAGECAAAAGKGHLDALAWLHSRGCPWNIRTCNSAAVEGHLEVLRYAHEHGCPWDSSTCYLAARGGHLEVLRYAHEHGCPWDNSTCYLAAHGGHFEVLRYAYERGCPWNSHTSYYAAYGGHLEVLRYAHEHGCPLQLEYCLGAALQNEHTEVVEYLRAADSAT
jgi:hypothetical protein